MEQDLRCDSKKHGILDTDSNTIEVKCDSRFCGAQRGLIVLHRFDLVTGQLVETKKYKNPTQERTRHE